jgi:hypothetical protein
MSLLLAIGECPGQGTLTPVPGYHPVRSVPGVSLDGPLLAHSAPASHPRRPVVDGVAAVHVGAEGCRPPAIAQLGVAAFFIAGVTRTALGDSAPWFVLAAAVLAAFVRTIDIESWALLIPGGFVSRVASAFGPRATGLAKALALVERVLLGALAGVVMGHYVSSVAATAIAGWPFTGHVRPEDLATLIAVGAIAVLWLPARIGRTLRREPLARAVWIGVAILLVPVAWGGITLALGGGVGSSLVAAPTFSPLTGWPPLDAVLALLLGFALVLPVIGGGEVLARAAHELPPPRVQALRRTALLTVVFAAVATILGTFLAILLVPASGNHSGPIRRWPAWRSTWPRLRR